MSRRAIFSCLTTLASLSTANDGARSMNFFYPDPFRFLLEVSYLLSWAAEIPTSLKKDVAEKSRPLEKRAEQDWRGSKENLRQASTHTHHPFTLHLHEPAWTETELFSLSVLKFCGSLRWLSPSVSIDARNYPSNRLPSLVTLEREDAPAQLSPD